MQRIKEKKHEIVYADEGIFGSGCVSENGAELKALGSRAMIVTGKHSSRINGSLAAVEQALQANGQTYVIFDEIEENPSVETVAVAAGIAVKEQVDFFVAVGGGSPMDASRRFRFWQRIHRQSIMQRNVFIIRSRCRAIRLQQSRPHPVRDRK